MWEKKKGCVYFFKHKNLDPIKVGYSTKSNPMKRLEQFKTYAPYGVELVAYVESSMALDMEKDIHQKYNSKRLCGEWFNITLAEVDKEIEHIKKIETLFNKNFS